MSMSGAWNGATTGATPPTGEAQGLRAAYEMLKTRFAR